MRNITLAAIAVSLLSVGFYLTREPEFKPARHSPKILLDGFYSFSSTKHVEWQLSSKTLNWIQNDQSFSGGGGRPLLIEVTYEVQGYQHLGVSGSLFLSFANDRLWSVSFRPNVLNAYMLALDSKLGVDFTASGHLSKNGVETIITENQRDEIQVRWFDKDLSVEQAYWGGGSS